MKRILLIVALTASVSLTRGQSDDSPVHHDHEFKRFRVALNLAHAYMPAAIVEESNFVILPVWGFDFQFWVNKHWGIGLKNDIEIARYSLTEVGDSGEPQLRDNPFIISLPVYFSPWDGGLTFFAGPGIELEPHHDFFVFRMGIGYEIHLARNWDVAPEIVYDLKGGHINAFTMAIGFGKRF